MRATARIGSAPARLRSGLPSWVMVMVVAHPYLTLLVVAGTVMRVITIVAYQPALLFHADAYAYLRVADHLEPSLFRPSLYPLLLRLIYPLHSLVPVVVVQHLVGIGMAIAIYALLRRLGVGALGGAIGAAPMFLDAYVLNIEHYVLSETLFQFLVLAALWTLSVFRTPPIALAAAAGIFLGLASITRVIGLVLLVPALLYLLWNRVGVVRIAACIVGFLIPVVSYGSWFYEVWGQFAITSRGNLILYGRVSPFADCENTNLPEYQRDLCDDRPASERPGTEFYVWRTEHPLSPLAEYDPPEGMDLQVVLGDFARRIILAQPIDYARVVGGDIIHYFAPGKWQEPRDAQMAPWEFTDEFDLGPSDRETIRAQKATGDNLPRVIRENAGSPEPTGLFEGDPPEFLIVPSLARFLDRYQDVVYTPGPLLALFALLGIVGIVLRPVPGRRRSVRPECFLFTSTGLALLFIPAATAVFDYRYLLPAIPLLSVSGVLGAYAITRRVRARNSVPKDLRRIQERGRTRRRGRSSSSSPREWLVRREY